MDEILQSEDKVVDWIKKTRQFGSKDTHIETREWETLSKMEMKENQGSNRDKIDSRTIAKDKARHGIMIKGSIQQEDTAIVNIYKPQKVHLYT